VSAPPATDALWLDTLHRIVARGAHELRGALNGVSVNLEVVRSRAEKPDAAASAVRTFANAAVSQLDFVIDMTEALLTLSRPAQQPVDIGRLFRSVGSLLVPAARADGRTIEFDGAFDDLGTTSATGSAARLIVGATFLAAIDASSHVICRALPNGPLSSVYVRLTEPVTPELAEGVIAAARAEGIQVLAEPSAISISFPH
jgi:signal transduction histidine kinase